MPLRRQVPVHYRFVSTPSTWFISKLFERRTFNRSVDYAQEVFGRFGMEIVNRSTKEVQVPESILSAAGRSYESCYPFLTPADTPALYALHDAIRAKDRPIPRREIAVYFLKRLPAGRDGCQSQLKGHPAAWVDYGTDPGVLAHEIGHVLLGDFKPVHSDDPLNLMHNPPPVQGGVARLTKRQETKMKSWGLAV